MSGTLNAAVAPAAFREFYKDGLFTDMTIVDKDGTSVPLHKVVMCAASQVLKAALLGPFQEGQSSSYSIIHHDLATIRLFTDIVYGSPPTNLNYQSELRGSMIMERLLALKKVYALADELQAEEAMDACCLRVSRTLSSSIHMVDVDITESFSYLIKNAGRPEEYIKVVVAEFLLPRDTVDEETRKTLPDHTHVYESCLTAPTWRGAMIVEILARVEATHPFKECLMHDDFDIACENIHLAEAVLRTWIQTTSSSWDLLCLQKEFAQGMQESGLAWICLEQEMTNEHRVGSTCLWRCSTCNTILSTGDDNELHLNYECSATCSGRRGWKPVTRFIIPASGGRRHVYKIRDGDWEALGG